MGKLESLVIIGFGNQAQAWALNLRDSGVEVSIALRKSSKQWKRVEELRFPTLKLGPELLQKKAFALLIPDQEHFSFLEQNEQWIQDKANIIYAHGASLTQHKLGERFPKWSHLLLAPKAIASEVRFQYETKGKLGAATSLEASLNKEQDLVFIKNLAKALGINAGPYPTSFEHETYADLLSEQGLLCGLIPFAAKHSFDQLIRRGVSAEVAYMECWIEVKLISDAMVKKGPQAFFELISPYALIGAKKASDLFFDKEYQKKLEQLCTDIWDKTFFEEAQEVDSKELRKSFGLYWKDSDLQKAHDQLSNDLILK